MKKYERLAYKLFKNSAEKRLKKYPYTACSILKADMGIRADVYLSTVYLNCLFAAIISSGLSALLLIFSYGTPLFIKIVPVAVPFPLFITTVIYAYGNFYPENKARERQKDIDVHLPYALSYLSALSSAGVVPVEMFRSLARHKDAYGFLSIEASRMYRDVSLLGKDVIEALKNSAERSPSMRYREVVQGIIATVTSGGDLREYLLRQSQQCVHENRMMMKGFLETLGVFAESYVVVGAAFPLFLIIILSVMLFITTATMAVSTLFLYMIVFILLPVVSIAFAWFIKDIMPEV